MDAFDPNLNVYSSAGQPGYPHPHPHAQQQQHPGIQLGGQPQPDHHPHGGLQFEEDLKDIPQALANYGGVRFRLSPPVSERTDAGLILSSSD